MASLYLQKLAAQERERAFQARKNQTAEPAAKTPTVKPETVKTPNRTALVLPSIVDASSGGRNIEPAENPYLTVLNRFRQSREAPDAVTGAAPSGTTARSAGRSAGRSGSFGGGAKKTVDAGFSGGRKTAEERPDWGKIAGGTALGGLQQFTKGLSATAAAAEQLVSKPLGWVLGNEQFYQDAPFYRINQNMDREIAAHQARMEPEYEKAGTAGALLRDYGVPTVAAVPQAVTAFLTLGQSLAAQGTTAGLTAASTAAQSTGAAKIAGMVTDGLKNTAANPQFWLSFLSTAGPEYEQAKADGADDAKAYAYAALSGALNSLVEVGGGIDKLPDASRNALKEWAGSMIDEGKEEVVQGVISRALQRGMYGKDNPLASLTDEDAVANPRRWLEEFAGGAVVGGILGGAQLGVQRALAGPQKTFGETVQAQIMGNQPQSAAEAVPQVQAPQAAQAPQAQKNAAQGAASTSINTDPATHTAAEMAVIDEYRAAADLDLAAFYEQARKGETSAPYRMKPVTDRAAAEIEDITGKDVRGFATVFEPRIAQHISKEHGENGLADQSMRDPMDVSRMQYVLDNFDTAEDGGTTDAYWETKPNGRNRRARTVVFSKRLNGSYFVVEAVPITKKKSTYIVSAYMGKAGTQRPTDANPPVFTAKTENADVPAAVQLDTPLDGDGHGENRIPAGVSSGAEENISFPTPSVPQTGGNVNPPGAEISDRAKKQLSRADRRTLQNLAQITGSNIQFVPRAQLEQMAGPGAEGVQRNGQIYISEDAERPYMEIAKHEITHRLQQTAPEKYAELRDHVADLYREKGTLDSYIKGAMADAARAGQEISEEEALDEITADYAADLLLDEKAMRELARKDRGLLERMLDALRDFIAKVKTALGGKENAETAELEQSAAMLQAALEESAGNRSKATQAVEGGGSFSDEIARQFGGGDQRLATREGAELKRQIDALSRQNQRLREQMKRTTGAEMDEKSVRQLSRSLLKDYNSSYAVEDLAGRVGELYKKIAEQTMSEQDARAEARAIAGDILDGSQTEMNPLYSEYSELRKELRTRPIAVSKDLKSGMVEAWGDFRRQNFGRLKLGNTGTQVDVLYDELSDRFPEFFPEEIINPADQLTRMAEVADELQSVMGSAYEGAEMDRMADFLAGDILERFLETPRRAPTFADRQERRLQNQRAKDRARLDRAVAKERGRKNDALQALKDRHRAANKRRSENLSAAQRREQIVRHSKKLGEKLLRPTDKQHIPEELRGAAVSLLRSINSESGYSVGEDGKRIKTGEGPEGTATRRTQAARELQAQYAKIASEESLVVDPDLAGYLDEIAGFGDTPLANLGRDQLETIWKAVKAVEASVSNADKLLAQSRFHTVSGMAAQLDRDAKERKARSRFVPGIAQADGLLNLDMLTPETYLHKLGAAGDDLFRQMRSAQDRQTEIQAGALDRFRKVYEESKQNAWKLEKEANSFQIGDGKEIKLSTAEVMELYLLAGREQAMGHLLTGGIRPEAVKGRGIKLETTQGAVHLTGEDISSITGKLTPEQKKLADGMRDVMRYLAERGNEASMEVYGYEKFKEQNYWPIKTGDADTASDPAAKAASKTIPGYGMTKQTKPNAQTPVVLHSVFDTFAQHTAEMSTYAAWLGVNENATRLLNFKFYDGEGRANGTVKDLLGRVHGEGGTAYLEQLLSDIAQGTKAKRDTIFSSGGLTSAFKSSAIAGNFRVALQQPTAVLRAMEMISPKYFATSLNVKDGWEKAKQYAPIAQWKDWGYFEMDTGRSYKDLMLGEKNALGKLNSKLMIPAGAMDAVGWGYLWNVAEAETKANRQDLKPGSEDFYKAVAKRFGEVVDRTQVVDSVLHRTQLMRSGNAINKMASSFMSEPSKQYNEIVRGVYDFTAAGDGRAKIRAAKHIVRTALAMSVSFALNAVAQSLLDTNRDDDRDKDLGEKFQEKWVENFIDNYKPWNYIPYFKDLGSLASGYDVGRMDMTVAADILKAADTLTKAWNGTGKRTTLSAALDAFNQFCRAAGLPAQTIEKDVRGLVGTFFQGLGMHKALYDMDKLRYNIAIPDNRRIFVGHLYRAMDDNREDYEAIYQDLLDSGMDEKDIEDAMEDRMAKDLGYDVGLEKGLKKTSSLPVEYSAPGSGGSFDQEVRRQLERGGSWKDALPKDSGDLAKALDGLEPEDGENAVTKRQRIKEIGDSPFSDEAKELSVKRLLGEKELERYNAARKAGISVGAWCRLYEDIARAHEKRTGKSGSATQEDVRKALEQSRLSEAKKKAVWDSYGWKKEWGDE